MVQVIRHVLIKVAEKGTEAAAATAIDARKGGIVFAGSVMDPTK